MSNPEPDMYVYKMVTDNGGAPCVTGKLLSLAICKPKIRKSAARGSLIFGFGGKEYQERLIYIARVTGKLEGEAYYQQPKYAPPAGLHLPPGFRSRRALSHDDSAPVSSQNAPFPSYKAARVHVVARRRGGRMAAGGEQAEKRCTVGVLSAGSENPR